MPALDLVVRADDTGLVQGWPSQALVGLVSPEKTTTPPPPSAPANAINCEKPPASKSQDIKGGGAQTRRTKDLTSFKAPF